jgi:hypothetical protein
LGIRPVAVLIVRVLRKDGGNQHVQRTGKPCCLDWRPQGKLKTFCNARGFGTKGLQLQRSLICVKPSVTCRGSQTCHSVWPYQRTPCGVG